MRIINKNEGGSWVAVNGHENRTDTDIMKNLFHRLQDVQVWFADMDDSDAYSPAKEIAEKAVGTIYTSPRYLNWCIGTAFALMAKGKKAESARWKKYVEKFLRKKRALKDLKEIFTEEKVKKSLYKDVERFYRALPADKYYITRNVREVVEAYAGYLGFKGTFPEADDKGKIVESFINGNPGIKRYGCSGDSIEDECVIDVLDFYRKKGKIEDTIGVYVTEKPEESHTNNKFEVQVSKERGALLEILYGKAYFI